MADLVLYYGDKILPIPFECIHGLNMIGTDALSIELEPGFSGLPPGSTPITLRFESSLSPDQVNLIFARISQGESQPQNLSEPVVESGHESSVSAQDSLPRPKSSIAVFQVHDTRNTQPQSVTTELFAQPEPSSDDQPEELPPPLIQKAGSTGSSPIVESRPSPPPPTIEQPREPETRPNPEPPRHRRPIQYEPDLDNALKEHSSQIADKIVSGIEALTKSRLDGTNRFGQLIGASVDTLKEDIRTTMCDREHGSLKQLEASKELFQGNIQQFKRKAASMHQTLVGFEQDTQAMSAKITAIQRKVRKEIQQRRIDLENELKKLRKLIRNQNKADDSDLSDEEPIDFIPQTHN
jgi:hypothetical protein